MLPSSFRYVSFSFSSDVDEISLPNNNNNSTNVPPVVSQNNNQQQFFLSQTPPQLLSLPAQTSTTCDDGVFLAATPTFNVQNQQLLFSNNQNNNNNQPSSFFEHHNFYQPTVGGNQHQAICSSSSVSSSASIGGLNNYSALSSSTTAQPQTITSNKQQTSIKGAVSDKTSSSSSSATHQVRKERSRKAARNRRGRENKEFEQLANLLPFEQGISSQLDKASIVRLVISYLRLRSQTPYFLKAPLSPLPTVEPSQQLLGTVNFRNSARTAVTKSESSNEFLYEKCHGLRIQDALEGFLLVFEVARPSRILYISQTVAHFTGLALVDLIGRNIYDYLHPDDAVEINQQLAAMCSSSSLINNNQLINLKDQFSSFSNNNNNNANDEPSSSSSSTPSLLGEEPAITEQIASIPVNFNVRFRCTANKRGTFFKVPGYRLFSFVGRLCLGALPDDGQYALRKPNSSEINHENGQFSSFHFIGTALALPSVNISEYNLAPDQIVFKLDNYLRIIDYDANSGNNFGEISDFRQASSSWFSSSFLPQPRNSGGNNTTTLYDVCHPGDAERVREAFRTFLAKSQAMVPCLRICSDKESFIGDLWLAGIQPSASNLPTAGSNGTGTRQQQSGTSPSSSSAINTVCQLPENGVSIIAIFTPITRDPRLFSALSMKCRMMTADTTTADSCETSSTTSSSGDSSDHQQIIYENGSTKKRRITYENGSYGNNFATPFSNDEMMTQCFGMVHHEYPINNNGYDHRLIINQPHNYPQQQQQQLFSAPGFFTDHQMPVDYQSLMPLTSSPSSTLLPPNVATGAPAGAGIESNNNLTFSSSLQHYCLN